MNEALVSALRLLHDRDEDIMYPFCRTFSFSSGSRCSLSRKGSMTQWYIWILHLKQQRFLTVVRISNHLPNEAEVGSHKCCTSVSNCYFTSNRSSAQPQPFK
jgi:hypothetical protein